MLKTKLFFQKFDFYFLFGILFLLFLFYPELFFAKAGSLTVDHLFQHYPWAYLLSQSIHRLSFPFWTDLIHCGFPLVAEGQVGAFYLPNLVLYFLFPLNWAHAYMSLFHFLIVGGGLYFYARQMKMSAFGAFVSSFIFLFGGSYGGAYYNITSLKTIAWFPCMLFFFERFYERKKWFSAVCLSITIALSLLAGYLQIAIISIFILGVYVFLRVSFFSGDPVQKYFFSQIKILLTFGLAVFSAFLIALPQIALTYELAFFSNRINLTEDYAYAGSLSPLALTTYIFPGLRSMFRGNNLYMGILPLFFLVYAACNRNVRKQNIFKIWVALWMISFLLALGEWSPLYISLVKLTHFYSFRTPSKFLIFMCFSFAMLCGMGFEALWNSKESFKDHKTIWKASASFVVLEFLFLFAYGVGYAFMTAGRETANALGQWFLKHYIYGRSGHPHSLENYYERLSMLIVSAEDLMSPVNFWISWTLITLLVSLVFVLILRRSSRIRKWFLLFSLCLAFVDLYVFSFFVIRRDFAPFKLVEKKSVLIEMLDHEKAIGHLGRIYTFSGSGERLPLAPNLNILYGFEDVGAYSPFVMARYYESIGRFGNVNDSNGTYNPMVQFLLERLDLLNFLDVSHIISTSKIYHPELKQILNKHADNIFLYRNEGNRSRIHFVNHYDVLENWELLKRKLLEPHFDPMKTLLIEGAELPKFSPSNRTMSSSVNFKVVEQTLKSNYQRFEITVNQAGFLVISDMNYPGWEAKVNGRTVPIIAAYGLFRSVWLHQKGQYTVEFKYLPYHFI